VPILGIAFVGEAHEDSEDVISRIGGVRRLGRLPWLQRLDRQSLDRAFGEHFRTSDFA
jgi:dethiobiotin synthetase